MINSVYDYYEKIVANPNMFEYQLLSTGEIIVQHRNLNAIEYVNKLKDIDLMFYVSKGKIYSPITGEAIETTKYRDYTKIISDYVITLKHNAKQLPYWFSYILLLAQYKVNMTYQHYATNYLKKTINEGFSDTLLNMPVSSKGCD